jgi:hypothetical protein
LIGRPEGKRLLGRSRNLWEDNIRMDIMEINGKAWAGFIWLRMGISFWLL